MELLILIAVVVLSLLLIPLGLPGLWIMISSAVVYKLLVPGALGWFTIAAIVTVGVVAEWFEFTLAGKYARKYGGSRRASWGAIIGGTVGAIIGVPVPIVGPIIGGLVGAFAGALVGEMSRRDGGSSPTRVATGAMIGRAVAAAMKTGVGVLVAAWIVMAAM